MKSRNYVFTLFIKSPDDIWSEFKTITEPCSYMIYQVEQCKKTLKYHLQGYFEFWKPVRLSFIKKMFKNDTIHIELRKGWQEEAINYCCKEETKIKGPFEFGCKWSQGKRNDLEKIKDLKWSKL